MKNLYLTAFFFLFSAIAYGQYYEIDRGVIEQRPCEFDSTSTIDAYSKIRMYSTLNDEWDGPLDSSLCYSLVQIGNNWRFPSSDIPMDRSAFFEMSLDSPLTLDTSTVYMVWPLFHYLCSPFGCASVHLSLVMPDSSGNGITVANSELIYNSQYDTPICFPTEKNLDQSMNGIIYEFGRINENNNLYLYTPLVESHWYGTQIIPQTTGEYLGGWSPKLIRYWHDVYPTADSLSYTDVVPLGNPLDSTVAQLYIDFQSSLHFRNHTALRGSLVNGSDSIRHGLEVILQGNLCLIPFVEVQWEGGNNLVIDGGELDLHGATSCHMFGRGGRLKILSDSEFHYGHNGIGLLALRTGARIEIESGAELIIGGSVFMYEYGTETEPQQIYLELVEGAKLTFAEGSSLSNQYSIDGTMRLNIYMLGGELDLSGLSEAEIQLINLIYDTSGVGINDELTAFDGLMIYPNPTVDNLHFTCNIEKGTSLNYEIFDLSGKLTLQNSLITKKPDSDRFSVDVSALISGMYTLFLTNESGEIISRQKFIKN